jgi:hypothetical protein
VAVWIDEHVRDPLQASEEQQIDGQRPILACLGSHAGDDPGERHLAEITGLLRQHGVGQGGAAFLGEFRDGARFERTDDAVGVDGDAADRTESAESATESTAESGLGDRLAGRRQGKDCRDAGNREQAPCIGGNCPGPMRQPRAPRKTRAATA